MKLSRNVLVVLVAAMVGVWAGIAFGDDAPNAIQPAKKVMASDRWFVLTSPDGKGSGYLHITIKESGDSAAAVRVTYEFQGAGMGTPLVTVKQESLCLNDEWLSPVKLVTSCTRGNDTKSATATITRLNPKSTAGKLVVVQPDQANIENDVKERTVMFFTPLEIVARMPFEKDASVKFTVIDGFETWTGEDCELSYAGREELEIRGETQSLQKFTLKQVGRTNTLRFYWLNDKHEIVRAEEEDVILTPAPEEEARKAAAPQP